MPLRNWILTAALVALATPALGVVKAYNATPPHGTAGDRFGYTTTGCPPINPSPGQIQGNHTLEDTGGGTVTMNDFLLVNKVETNATGLDAVFGPGAFIFVTATPSIRTSSLPLTAPGSTAPSGSVAWGIIGGWQQTGIAFCISSPTTICAGAGMQPHGITSSLGPLPSATYDLGTWSFDAVGDLSASSYVAQTTNGGVQNSQWLIRGAYVGAAIPALPLVGAGALALGLAIAGARSLMRKK